MSLSLNDLISNFEQAKHLKKKCVFVEVFMRNMPKAEIIINPIENIDSKVKYYKAAYNEDLTLKANADIAIIGFGFTDDLNNIIKDKKTGKDVWL